MIGETQCRSRIQRAPAHTRTRIKISRRSSVHVHNLSLPGTMYSAREVEVEYGEKTP